MEKQHDLYPTRGGRWQFARRHQQVQDGLRAGAEIAPLPSRVRPIRWHKVLALLLLILLLTTLSQVASIPAADAFPIEEISPSQMEMPTHAFMGGSGCSSGRGVQTTKKTAC